MSQSAADSDQDPTTAAESYGDYSVDDEDQPVGEDNLVTGDGSDVVDEMDRGYNPPEKWSAAEGFGNTPYEESVGETLDQRLAQEEPDPAAKSIEEIIEEAEAAEEADGDLSDPDVGDVRAGRLVAPDEGVHTDVEKDLVAYDVGIDGAAASAEEAAVHVVDDEVLVDDDVLAEATVFDLVVDEDVLEPELVGDSLTEDDADPR